MEEKKINHALIFSILVTMTGWGVTFGVCESKIETNARDVARLESKHQSDISFVLDRQTNTDNLLNSINSQLVELNTKMGLLLNGKISTQD